MEECSQSYIILCKFDVKNPGSTTYHECSTLEQVYKFVTKLGIQVYHKINKQATMEAIEMKEVVRGLKSVPFLKVYSCDPGNKMEYLKAEVDFAKGYVEYIKRVASDATEVYEEIKKAAQSEEFIKEEIESAATGTNVTNN